MILQRILQRTKLNRGTHFTFVIFIYLMINIARMIYLMINIACK